MIDYTRAYNNKALTKRLGYLAELLAKKRLKSFIGYAKSEVNERYNLIDAGGVQEGEFNPEWKLRLNVSEQNLLNMAKDRL